MAQQDKQSAMDKRVDKLEDEVREQQIDAQTENILTNVPSQGEHGEVLGTSASGKSEKVLRVDSVGETTIVSIGNQEVRFQGAEGRAALARKFRNVGSNG